MWIDPSNADDLAFVRRHWKDSSALDVATISELLEVAEEGVAEFAPAPAVDPVTLDPIIPSSWRIATVYQAREIRAAAVREGGMVQGEAYAVRPRPLLDTVRQLVRPRKGRRAIG